MSLDGGAVPAHVGEGLLAGLLDFARRLGDGLHQFQIGAAQLGLGGHQAGQRLALLRPVDVLRGPRQRPAPDNRTANINVTVSYS